MAGHVITVGSTVPENWRLGRDNGIWATRARRPVRAGDDLFFWMSGGVGLIAYARATTDATPVTRYDRLPWPDHHGKPYHYKFAMELVAEPSAPVVTKWADIQSAIGTGVLASNGFSTVKTDQGVSQLAVYFTGERHGDDTPPLNELDIPSDLDTRAWQTRAIAARRGQRTFRRQLLDAYGGACAITGSRVADVLEAAHIAPYRGQHTNDARNGLLLRSDVHTLFDLHRLTVLPTRQVRVDPGVGGDYARLNGHSLTVVVEQLGPDSGLLRQHNEKCRWLR